MVVFTCHNCGDSVKKPKVDKHISYECKKKNYGRVKLCCIDCLNDFDAETYVKHTSCVSEAERYSAPGFIAKPSANKGVKKQNSWIEVLSSVSNQSDLTKPQHQLLQALIQHQNVPRKKNKFQNFVKSSVKHIRVNPQTVDQLYDLLEQAFKQTSEQNINNVKKTPESNVNSEINYAGKSSNAEDEESQNKSKQCKLESSSDMPPEDGKCVIESTIVADESSKQKKKQKYDRTLENQTVSINDDDREKKKKRVHYEQMENRNGEVMETAINVDDNSSTSNNNCSEVVRKKKKKRKNNDMDESLTVDNALPDPNAKRRKKSQLSNTDSGKPDENLTEKFELVEKPVKIKKKKHRTENIDTMNCTIEEPEISKQSDTVENTKIVKKKKKKKRDNDSSALEQTEADETTIDDTINVDGETEKMNLEAKINESAKKRKKKKLAIEETPSELPLDVEDIQIAKLHENGISKKKKKMKQKIYSES